MFHNDLLVPKLLCFFCFVWFTVIRSRFFGLLSPAGGGGYGAFQQSIKYHLKQCLPQNTNEWSTSEHLPINTASQWEAWINIGLYTGY